jgi:hypothetical protein
MFYGDVDGEIPSISPEDLGEIIKYLPNPFKVKIGMFRLDLSAISNQTDIVVPGLVFPKLTNIETYLEHPTNEQVLAIHTGPKKYRGGPNLQLMETIWHIDKGGDVTFGLEELATIGRINYKCYPPEAIYRIVAYLSAPERRFPLRIDVT